MALPDTVPYLGWAWDDLVFLALGGLLLGTSLLVVLSRNIIRSGLWMVLSFATLAGLYALAGATLVAAAQVLVYIGAISVLILFAVMLTQSKAGPARLVFHHQAWAAAIASVFVGLLLIISVLYTTWPLAVPVPLSQSARDVALLLFEDYVLAFEVVGLLLLAAVIGGIYLARREESPEVAVAGRDVTAVVPAGAAGATMGATPSRATPVSQARVADET